MDAVAAALPEDELMDFRTNIHVEFPERLHRASYKLLWGAGDYWILSERFFAMYDVFVSFGGTGGAGQFGDARPPAADLSTLEIDNNSDAILRVNRANAQRLGKIIVYLDSNNTDQVEAFSNMFRDRISLFEELGVHNEINGITHVKMLKTITQIDGIINLSAYDEKCDGGKSISDVFNDTVGIEPCVIYPEIHTAPIIAAERRVYFESIIATRPSSFQIEVDISTLTFNELNFIASHIKNETLRLNYGRDCSFIINNQPRLYSITPVLRMSIQKIRNFGTNIVLGKILRNLRKIRSNNTWSRRKHAVNAYYTESRSFRKTRRSRRNKRVKRA